MGLFNKKKGKKKGEEMDLASQILPQEIYNSNVLEMRDVIAPSALKLNPKHINLGEKIVRTFFVISYPRFLPDSWFSQ